MNALKNVKLESMGLALDISAQPDDAQERIVRYLLNYGFAKSLQDSAAGAAKAASEAFEANADEYVKMCEELAIDPDASRKAYTAETFAQAVGNARRAKRLEAIITGTIGQRGPAKAKETPEQRTTREVSIDLFRPALVTAVQKKTGAAPAKADLTAKALAEHPLFTVFCQKAEAKIKAEVKRRMALDTTIELDLD